MNVNTYFKYTRRSFLLLGVAFLVLACNLAFAEDELDRLMNRCAEGNSEACDEIEILIEKNKEILDRIDAHADAFQAESSSLDIEHDKIPDIKKAYPIILNHYINSEIAQPVHKTIGLNSELVKICSKHLHDLYFVHKKEIPLLESGHPDWAIIYMVTIDHYFRFCIKSVNTN